MSGTTVIIVLTVAYLSHAVMLWRKVRKGISQSKVSFGEIREEEDRSTEARRARLVRSLGGTTQQSSTAN